MLDYRFLPVLVALFGSVLSGCVTNPYSDSGSYLAMMPGTGNHLQSTRVIVGLDPQNDLNVVPTPQANSGQQYGLLGVVVDTIVYRTMDATRQAQERLMLPIRNAAIQYNFGGQFRAELEESLRQVQWLHVTYVSKEPGFQRYKTESIMPEVTEDAVLISDTFYRMEPDFSKLTITAYVVMYPRNEFLRSLAKKDQEQYPILYRNRFTYQYALESPYVDARHAAEKWGEQNGAMVKRALEAGIRDIVARIAAEMRT